LFDLYIVKRSLYRKVVQIKVISVNDLYNLRYAQTFSTISCFWENEKFRFACSYSNYTNENGTCSTIFGAV